MSTVDKALDILELFSDIRPSIGLSEAARLLDRDKASTLRYLTSLETKGFLEQDPLSRSYHLGPTLARLSLVRERTYPLNKAVRNILIKLVQDTGETAHLSHINHDSLSQIAIEETAFRGTRVYMDPAEPLSFHGTASGIAYLSQLPEDQVLDLVSGRLESHTKATPTRASEILRLVAQAREQGYAISTGTFEADVCGIAAPVFGPSEQVVGAVAVASPMSRITPEICTRISGYVVQAAHLVSRHYGARSNVKQAAAQ